MPLRSTPLIEVHKALGAKILPFAGYLMPIEYTGITDEHINVRNSCGIFDVSHMGEFFVKGPGAFELLQYVTTNDVAALYDGKIQYSCLPNGKGGIVDDILIYRFNAEKFLLVVNALNIDKDWEWLNKNNRFGAILENVSDSTAQLAIQGPNAIKILQKLTHIDLTSIPYYSFNIGEFAGKTDVIISATGYTGAGGFELYFKPNDAIDIWNSILKAGENMGIKPAGLGSRNTLRLEMGYCLYGNDIDDNTSPIEAGLEWIVKMKKENHFIDKELYYKQIVDGVSRKLVGFKMIEKGIPRQGYEVLNEKGQKIGYVTSGSISPMLKLSIGMAYVSINYCKVGTKIWINIRNKPILAEITNKPFVKPNIR